MRRRTVRALRRVPALSLALGLLAACSTHPAPPISASDLQLARQFGLYTVYWVGPSFHGNALTAADSKRDYDAAVGMRVYYGNCGKPSSVLSTRGCQLPLEIATVLYKPHSNEGLGRRRATLIRGVPAEVYNGGSSIELYTGHTLAIDVYADSPSLAMAAAQALVPLNREGPPAADLVRPTLLPAADPAIRALAAGLPPVAAAVRRPRRG